MGFSNCLRIALFLCSAAGIMGRAASAPGPPSSPIIGSVTNKTKDFVEDGSSTNSTNDTIGAEYKLGDWKKCEKWQQIAIRDAFSEMIDLIGREYIPPDDPPDSRLYRYVDWKSSIAIDYFGSAAILDSHTKDVILDNLDRAASITHQWVPWASKYSIRCDDPLNMCCDGNTYAYTLEHSAKVNFCPKFFTLPTLQGAMDLVAGHPSWAGYIQGYLNRAVIWAHEIMHNRDIGLSLDGTVAIGEQPLRGYPQDPNNPIQWSYGPLYTKWLAQKPSALYYDAMSNADNYAWFFLANYVIRKRGFYPSLPQVPVNPWRAQLPEDYLPRPRGPRPELADNFTLPNGCSSGFNVSGNINGTGKMQPTLLPSSPVLLPTHTSN